MHILRGVVLLIPVVTVLFNFEELQVLRCINKRDLLVLNNIFEQSKHFANCLPKNN